MRIFPIKILLATDGSEEAGLAVRAATNLAAKTSSELHLIHVLTLPPKTHHEPLSFDYAGFNDDTRTFASIPARHDVWRRVTCDWLAGMDVRGVIEEEDAVGMAWELTYGLAKRSYGLKQQLVRSVR